MGAKASMPVMNVIITAASALGKCAPSLLCVRSASWWWEYNASECGGSVVDVCATEMYKIKTVSLLCGLMSV